MRDFVIMTDSCCDMTAQMAEELELKVLPLSLLMGQDTYRNWLDGREIGFHDFYERIRAGATATTSAISVGDFEEAMRPILQEGRDILYLAFSSGLSTTCHSAVMAANELQEKYPERKIYVVDTLSASLGEGLLVWYACKKRDEGLSLEALRDWVTEMRFHLCHWFTVDDLMYLKRGGRISATTAIVGTMLGIKPVLHMDDEGHLISMSKARGRKASIEALAAKMGELGKDYDNSTVFICHGDCIDDARYLEKIVREKYGAKNVVIGYTGAVIGSHSGPGTLALFFLGKNR